MQQRIRFCTSYDGVRIAYATGGSGPPLVKAANWLSHLEFDANSPVWRHWLNELSRDHTLLRYDQRGCGLSDWEVADLSFEASLRDLEKVVDSLGLERFALLGLSHGAAIAVAYAVRHPQKVSQLVLYGGYIRGRLRRTDSPHQAEEAEMLLELIRHGWGKEHHAFRQVYTTLFIPGGTAEQVRWFNDLQRLSTSPEIAARLISAYFSIDVSDLARKVEAPTLVLHGLHDAVVPFAEGRLMAALIPGARFVPLESSNHVLLADEPAWKRFLAEVTTFLGVEASGPGREPLGGRPDSLVLTRREREVAALIGTGRSNRAIADTLVVSERTVEWHTGNILSKLGFQSRSQIAAWAVEQNLPPRS